jgi:hypothetical protein
MRTEKLNLELMNSGKAIRKWFADPVYSLRAGLYLIRVFRSFYFCLFPEFQIHFYGFAKVSTSLA